MSNELQSKYDRSVTANRRLREEVKSLKLDLEDLEHLKGRNEIQKNRLNCLVEEVVKYQHEIQDLKQQINSNEQLIGEQAEKIFYLESGRNGDRETVAALNSIISRLKNRDGTHQSCNQEIKELVARKNAANDGYKVLKQRNINQGKTIEMFRNLLEQINTLTDDFREDNTC